MLSEQMIRAISKWNSEKPVTGNIAPELAFATLEKYERQFITLKTDQDLILRANDALEIDLSANNSVAAALQELQDFKSVWSALSSVWLSLNDLRETPWISVVARKVKNVIDELIETTKEMPSRMRQYASFEYVQGVLRQFQKSNTLLADLKSDVMRERHWDQVYRALGLKEGFALGSLTLGKVWDLNLVKNESVILNILTQARGEMALEDFLKQVSIFYLNIA